MISPEVETQDLGVASGPGSTPSGQAASRRVGFAGTIPNAPEQCTLGVGCDQYGVCYADAHGRPDQCPHYERDLEANAWAWLDALFTDVTGGRHANDRDYSADEMVDAFIAGHASAIEARRAETGTGSVHESADPKGDAQ